MTPVSMTPASMAADDLKEETLALERSGDMTAAGQATTTLSSFSYVYLPFVRR